MKTTNEFMNMKKENDKIIMLTAYDYPSAKLAADAGVEILLVGDSLGMVVLGYESTVPVTIEDMLHHGKAARRGAPDTFLVVDMPFGSYHGSFDVTLKNAMRLFQETNAQALKVEGAEEVIDVIRRLSRTGIPVIGHLGLLPQSASVSGGYKVQGKTAQAAQKLIEDAQACEAAGAVMVVLECIPHQLAKTISNTLTIPVIGIGAGEETDGQVLVFHDIVTYGSHHMPKFVKAFAQAGKEISAGVVQYVEEVKSGLFPAPEHRFTMKDDELQKLYGGLK